MSVFTLPSGPFTDMELKAYIETMMLVAIADGTVRNSELNIIQMAVVGYLESNPDLKNMNRQQLMELCFDRANALYSEGIQPRLKAIASVLTTPEKRMYALGMAVAVAIADGFIQTGERAGFTLIQRVFELTDEQVQAAISAFS